MFKLSSFEKEVLTTLKTHGYEFIARDYDGSLIAYNGDLGSIKLQVIKSFVSDVYFEFIKRGDSYIAIDTLMWDGEMSKGMENKEWIEIKAREISDRIFTFFGKGSGTMGRLTDENEKRIIYNLVVGVLNEIVSINFSNLCDEEQKESAKNTAIITATRLLETCIPYCDGKRTIYLPVKKTFTQGGED